MMEERIYKVAKPANDKVGIDIIVPTHGRLELTIPCIDRLYTFTKIPFHLIVVDSDPKGEEGLTQKYMELLTKNKDNVTFIHAEKFNTGNEFFNIAFQHAQTDYIATVMNSTWVEPEWETVALSIMAEQPDVGIIGLKSIFAPGHPHFGQIESAGIAMNGFTPSDIGRDLPGHRLNSVYGCDAVQWAFAILRKQAVVGNLDNNTFHGFVGWDDIDNCFVVRSKGWRILYCGMGAAYHHPRATRGDNSQEAAQKNLENAQIFYKRWGYWDAFCKASGIVPENRAERRRKVKAKR